MRKVLFKIFQLYYILFNIMAAMVELVDTLVLGTSAFGCQGSNPCCGTRKNNFLFTEEFVD